MKMFLSAACAAFLFSSAVAHAAQSTAYAVGQPVVTVHTLIDGGLKVLSMSGQHGLGSNTATFGQWTGGSGVSSTITVQVGKSFELAEGLCYLDVTPPPPDVTPPPPPFGAVPKSKPTLHQMTGSKAVPLTTSGAPELLYTMQYPCYGGSFVIKGRAIIHVDDVEMDKGLVFLTVTENYTK
jgi:hypothetical protein